jgi:hypothetical protein
MGMVYRVTDSDHQLQLLPNSAAVLFCVPEQRLAPDEFHREIGLRSKYAIYPAGFINLGDAWVLEPAQGDGFLLEAPEQLGIRDTALDHFERYRAPGLLLFGLIYDTHAAFAKQTENPISANGSGQSGCRSSGYGSEESRHIRPRCGIRQIYICASEQ